MIHSKPPDPSVRRLTNLVFICLATNNPQFLLFRAPWEMSIRFHYIMRPPTNDNHSHTDLLVVKVVVEVPGGESLGRAGVNMKIILFYSVSHSATHLLLLLPPRLYCPPYRCVLALSLVCWVNNTNLLNEVNSNSTTLHCICSVTNFGASVGLDFYLTHNFAID